MQALSDSRFLSPEEVGSFFDLKIVEKNYESWVEFLIKKFKYTSRRDVFKKMKHCLIDRVDGVITIKPTNHEKIEAWSGKGIDSKDYEVINDTAPETDIGQALKRCISRCIG